ncbi:hypothetical protein FWD20_03055 [Candidatus Saccharibacteria bacterium]|nr:hypothetical protein [Candidatus Saccharibacteria bacterium]
MKTSLRYKLVLLARRLGAKFDGSNDPNVIEMLREIKELGGLQFSIEHAPDGNWLAKSTNVDGILTGGDARDDVNGLIKDAVFTYYGIAPKYCSDTLIRLSGESKVIRQEVLAAA